MSQTTNLQLPFLASAQAQKHVIVNEALLRLDALVQLSVVSATTSAEPGSPSDGALYILPAGKTGTHWGAMGNEALAYYRDGAWEEIAPREGWLAYASDSDRLLRYAGAAWTQFTAAQAASLTATDRIVGRVSSGAGPAEEITFTDQAQQLCDDASFRAMCATLGAWHALAHSGAQSSHTGNTTETALATVTVPAGAMGPNGALRILAGFSGTSSANNKTVRVKFGSLSGTNFLSTNITTNGLVWGGVIMNRNAQNAQIGAPNGVSGVGSIGYPFLTAAIDTSASTTLVFAGTLANAGETVSLEYFYVDVLYGA